MFVVYLVILVVVAVVSFKYGKNNNKPAPVNIDLPLFETISDHLTKKFGKNVGSVIFQTATYISSLSRNKITLSVQEEAKREEKKALDDANRKESLAENALESSEDTAVSLEEQAKEVRRSGQIEAARLRKEAEDKKRRAGKLTELQTYMQFQ